MKTIFVVLYGLIAMVQTDKEMWVLLPDTAGMHYADHTAAETHYADLAVRRRSEQVSAVLSLMGDDLVIGAGTGDVTRDPEGDEYLLFLENLVANGIATDAHVDADCLDADLSRCALGGRRLLAGRIRLLGPAKVAPIEVQRRSPAGTDELVLLPVDEGSKPHQWAFRAADNPYRLGTYQGKFSSGVLAALTVPSDWKGVLTASGEAVDLASAAVDDKTCADYGKEVGMTAAEARGCGLLWVTNLPVHGESKRDLPGDVRDHSELVFELLQNRFQPRAVLYRRTLDTSGPGSPPSGLCIGYFLKPPADDAAN